MSDSPEQKEAKKVAKLKADLEALGITGTTGTETIAPLTGEETSENLAEILKTAKAEPPRRGQTGPITIQYRDHLGRETERTFSKEVHGDDFEAGAAEFKKTNADKIIAA
jgi:hypothetical protein